MIANERQMLEADKVASIIKENEEDSLKFGDGAADFDMNSWGIYSNVRSYEAPSTIFGDDHKLWDSIVGKRQVTGEIIEWTKTYAYKPFQNTVQILSGNCSVW